MQLEANLFNEHFSKIYSTRWSQIYKALTSSPFQVYRMNRFSKLDLIKKNEFSVFEDLIDCFVSKNFLSHERDENEINIFYKMDPSSVFVANALNVKMNENVLDMCAAPGGKTLILAEALNGTGQLICNEISKDRRERLNRVIQSYIPFPYRQNIFVKGLDGNQYGLKSPDSYDAILCDVPCSGERHLVENKAEFDLWTPKRSKNLSLRQYSLLSSAWLACRNGGRIVYSTCSLSPFENDEVVRKLVKRRSVEIQKPSDLKQFKYLERTEFGYQVLPDSAGFGPMFFSIILKV